MTLNNNLKPLEAKFNRVYSFGKGKNELFRINVYIDRIERFINALDRKPGNHHEQRRQLLDELHRMQLKKRNMLKDE